eukprot:scaffold67830_cov40-Phaeocystis_antarctica.AAC.1
MRYTGYAAHALQDSRAALLAFVMGAALGFRPAPGTPSGTRSVGTRRAVRVVCMPSEGTARAAQLAASAVTASAVGGSATRSVVAESLRRRAARRGARAIARRGGANFQAACQHPGRSWHAWKLAPSPNWVGGIRFIPPTHTVGARLLNELEVHH